MNKSFQYYIISLKPQKPEHLLFLSVLFFSFGTFFYSNLTTTIGQVFRLFGFFLFIIVVIKNGKNQPFSGLPLFLYTLLLFDITFISFYTFFIADSSLIGGSLYEMGMNIFSSDYFLPSIMPFMLLIFREGYSFDIKYLVRLMLFVSIIYLIISPFALTNMLLFNYDPTVDLEIQEGPTYEEFATESTLHISAFEIPIILFYWKKYFSNKYWFIFLLVAIIPLFITLFLARRGQSAITLSYFIFCYIVYLLYDKDLPKLKFVVFGLVIILFGFFFVLIGSKSFLSLIIERGLEDTRSGVEQNFYDSLDLSSIVFGRGWFGQYYDNIFDIYRSGIETGYLTLILRGGCLYLFLYVSLLLYSGFKGFFLSKSIFVKSYAIIIIISILSLYPFGWPFFNFYFLFIWMGVFICNNDFYLKLTDLQIKLMIFKKTEFILFLLAIRHFTEKRSNSLCKNIL